MPNIKHMNFWVVCTYWGHTTLTNTRKGNEKDESGLDVEDTDWTSYTHRDDAESGNIGAPTI